MEVNFQKWDVKRTCTDALKINWTPRRDVGDQKYHWWRKFWQFPHMKRTAQRTRLPVSRCAVINNLIQYQETNPVSSITASAAPPKTEKYLGNCHFRLLIAALSFLFPILVANKLRCQPVLLLHTEIWHTDTVVILPSVFSLFPFLFWDFILFYFYFIILATSTSIEPSVCIRSFRKQPIWYFFLFFNSFNKH